MADEFVVIDGSQGEGGGQILRTSLGLAAALGRAVKVVNIRANRPKPGLAAQHLAAVRAAAAVCQGRLAGDALGSRELSFKPGQVKAGSYRFDIGTAGSTTLVLQTVLPALIVADGDSDVAVTGGTHNPMAPCFEYLRDVFGVLASAMNVQVYFEMVRAGFFPAGGGEVRMQVRGGIAEDLAPICLTGRGSLKGVEGLSAAAESLPHHIIERQAAKGSEMLAAAGCPVRIEQAAWPTHSPGTAVFLRAAFARTVAGFSALCKRGKPAEAVAAEAASALLDFLKTDAALDPHAADQIITIAALCPDQSRFTTQCITDHLLTNAAVIRQVAGRKITVEGSPGGAGCVTVEMHPASS
ncbi:MAG: RNA 3'-terminal phosphate cyclase [Phycisphaerae bacterium]